MWRGWHVDECEAGDPDLDGADDHDDDGAVDPDDDGSVTSAVCASPDAGARACPTHDRGAHPHRQLRSFFGDWQDVDHDCQDTRAEVLIAASAVPITMKPGTCTVAWGQWTDPWSAQVTTDGRALDVDHDVPLANAWRSGAWAWDSTRLHAYANDLADADHLNAIVLGENRSKGDGGPEQWKPPAPGSWCHYALAWDHVKATWGLTATLAEWSALVAMAATC